MHMVSMLYQMFLSRFGPHKYSDIKFVVVRILIICCIGISGREVLQVGTTQIELTDVRQNQLMEKSP